MVVLPVPDVMLRLPQSMGRERGGGISLNNMIALCRVFLSWTCGRIEIVHAHLSKVGQQLVDVVALLCCRSYTFFFFDSHSRLLVSLIVTSLPHPRPAARFQALGGNLQTNNPLFFLSYIHCHYDDQPLSGFSRAFTTRQPHSSRQQERKKQKAIELFRL